MENNANFTNTPDLTPNVQDAPSTPSAAENMTLDPFGNQAEIEKAKEEVTAASAIFGGMSETPAAPAAPAPAPEAPAAPAPEAPQQPQYDQPVQNPQQPQYGQPVQNPQQPQYGQLVQNPQPQYEQQNYDPNQQYVQPAPAEPKSKMAAGLLGIFLGAFGVHNFYLGYTGKAVAQLLISVLSCFTLAIASEIWGLVEGIMILTGSINTDAKGVPLKE